MTLASDLITRARFLLNAEKIQNYKDPAELLNYLNDAHIQIHAYLRTNMAGLLEVEDDSISTVAGVATITVPAHIGIQEVRVDKIGLYSTDRKNFSDLTITGRPEYYWLQGWTRVRIHPIPDSILPVALVYIPAAVRLAVSDTVPYPTNFEPMITEYIAFRAGITDEFNMTTEAQLDQLFMGKIEDIVRQMVGAGAPPTGYYNQYGAPSGDYQ